MPVLLYSELSAALRLDIVITLGGHYLAVTEGGDDGAVPEQQE